MEEKDKKIMIGIDIGTSNFCVYQYEKGQQWRYSLIENIFGWTTTPSCVNFKKNGEIIVAKDHRDCIDLEDIVSEAKRLIGRKEGDPIIERVSKNSPYKIVFKDKKPFIHIDGDPDGKEERDYSPEEILAYIFSETKRMIKKRTGRHPDECAITVPAYFSEPQREAIILAAEMAELKGIRLINDSTAIALACREEDELKNGKVLICDLGGGSFDFTVLDVNDSCGTVLAYASNDDICGEDIDSLLCEEIYNRFAKKNPGKCPPKFSHQWYILKQECKKFKEQLPDSREGQIAIPNFFEGIDLDEIITRSTINFVTYDYLSFSDTIKCALDKACINISDINQIILAGGLSNNWSIKEQIFDDLEDYEEIIEKKTLPETIAKGAAVFLHDINSIEEEGEKFVIKEKLPISIGIKAGKNAFIKIFESGSTYPKTNHYDFVLSNTDTDYANLELYQGEKEIIQNSERTHISIGKYRINVQQGTKDVIEVNMEIDQNGILKLTAKIKGKEEELHVEPPKLLTNDYIQEATERIHKENQIFDMYNENEYLLNKIIIKIKKLHRKKKEFDYNKYSDQLYSIDEYASKKENEVIAVREKLETILNEIKTLTGNMSTNMSE